MKRNKYKISEKYGVNLSKLEILYDEGILSFNLSKTEDLNSNQASEILFYWGLLKNDLTPSQIKKITRGLKKPFCYSLEKFYFDWSSRSWKLIPSDATEEEFMLEDAFNLISEHVSSLSSEDINSAQSALDLYSHLELISGDIDKIKQHIKERIPDIRKSLLSEYILTDMKEFFKNHLKYRGDKVFLEELFIYGDYNEDKILIFSELSDLNKLFDLDCNEVKFSEFIDIVKDLSIYFQKDGVLLRANIENENEELFFVKMVDLK